MSEQSDRVGELKIAWMWGSWEEKAHQQGCLGMENRDSQGSASKDRLCLAQIRHGAYIS